MLQIQNNAYITIIITGVFFLVLFVGLLTLLKFVPPMFKLCEEQMFAKIAILIIFGIAFVPCILNLAISSYNYLNPQAEVISRINHATKLVTGD